MVNEWVGCHSPEVRCAPLAAGTEVTRVRALSPGPVSARLLAAGACQEGKPAAFPDSSMARILWSV